MVKLERLDKIAKKLPPQRQPAPEPLAFVDDWPGPVLRYLEQCFSAAAQPGDDPKRAGERAADEPACGDILRAIARAARLDRRAPTLAEAQEALLTGAGNRLARMLGDERNADGCSALAWELLFSDSETFGRGGVFCLTGSALADRWRRGHTDDAATLALAGFGELELRFLSES